MQRLKSSEMWQIELSSVDVHWALAIIAIPQSSLSDRPMRCKEAGV
jgi:hypothetical protein